MEVKWYVVRTFSGHENKVKQALEVEMQDNENLKSKIKEILVPTEKVFEVKDGKKRSKTKNFFPGYILVQAELDNQVKVQYGLNCCKNYCMTQILGRNW